MSRTLPWPSVIAALVVMVPEVLIEVVPPIAPLVMADLVGGAPESRVLGDGDQESPAWLEPAGKSDALV